MRRLRERLAARSSGAPQPGDTPELALLKKALAVEGETSAFYTRMVERLPAEGRDLFRRFLDIEEGHGAIVQAQIDAVTGLGFWFDIREFDLERG